MFKYKNHITWLDTADAQKRLPVGATNGEKDTVANSDMKWQQCDEVKEHSTHNGSHDLLTCKPVAAFLYWHTKSADRS